MNFDFTEEQTMIRETVKRFMREKYDFDTRQAIIASDAGWSPEIWQQLAEMGLMGAAFPEEYDGFGGTAADIMVLMEEFGEGLLIEPFFPTAILAGQILREVGGEEARALIGQIIAGEMIMAFAHDEPKARGVISHVETTARLDGDGFILNGQKAVVLGAPLANRLIISARTSGQDREEDGISLFLVDPGQDGLSIHAYPTIDGMRAGDVHLDQVHVPASALLGTNEKAYPVISTVIDRAITAMSAEAAGLCRKMSDLTRDYCRQREQFGQPISKFQVLQHQMVDMFIHTEEMSSMAYMAAMNHDTPGRDTARAAAAAKVQIGKSVKFVGETAVQLHGGMGITEEMAVGHYFMHATMMENLLGDSNFHLRRFQGTTHI
ncbi:MAG: acyl-CoA dehydrogenase family protein [Pseudomonadota bacterium]